MTENPFHIAEVITAYLQDKLTSGQRAELEDWLKIEANKKFLAEFTDKNNFGKRLVQFTSVNSEITWGKTLSLLDVSKRTPKPESTIPNTIRKIFLLENNKWVAAAAAVSIIFLSIYFLRPAINDNLKRSGENRNLVVNDVAPGKQGATLTLANGKTIQLTGHKNAVVANASAITYEDGSLVDSSLVETMKQPDPGTMLLASTSNGRTYIFTLSDGTKVWLNAASTIKFPLTFTGKTRRVEVTGEAYLEVFKDKARPFVVISTGQELEVLGTHFNLRSYPEEQGTKTTLIEGSVRLSQLSTNSNSEVVLKPNEQSISKAGMIKVQQANTSLETAWIKNDFYFRGETLANVLRDVARWYDVEIIYSNEEIKSIPLIGQISRTKPLSAVLERIASAGSTRFKIEGKQVTVMPDIN